MKVLIREGSAARNFDALVPLLHEEPGMVMFCSDDKHPDELVKGHINQLVSRAVKQGFPLFDVLRAATLNPVEHYGLDAGLLGQVIGQILCGQRPAGFSSPGHMVIAGGRWLKLAVL